MKLIPLVVVLLLSSTANADVMYQWQPVNDAAPYNFTMNLTFSDDTVASGSYSVSISNSRQLAQMTGLLSLYYVHGQHNGLPMNLSPAGGVYAQYPWLDMNVVFLDDGTLSGSFVAGTFESSIHVESDGNLFTVVGAGSDAGMGESGCAWGQSCGGAQGIFQRVDPAAMAQAKSQALETMPPSELPEPASLALVSFGLLGALRARRS